MFVIAFVISGTLAIPQYTSPDLNKLYSSAAECEIGIAKLYGDRTSAVCVVVISTGTGR